MQALNNCFIRVCYYFQLAICLEEPNLGRLTVFSTYFLYSCHPSKVLIFNFMSKHKCTQLVQDIQLSCFGVVSKILINRQRIKQMQQNANLEREMLGQIPLFTCSLSNITSAASLNFLWIQDWCRDDDPMRSK